MTKQDERLASQGYIEFKGNKGVGIVLIRIELVKCINQEDDEELFIDIGADADYKIGESYEAAKMKLLTAREIWKGKKI